MKPRPNNLDLFAVKANLALVVRGPMEALPLFAERLESLCSELGLIPTRIPKLIRRAVQVKGKARTSEPDIRALLALLTLVLFFALLFVTLAFRADMFETVAAATTGLVGAVFGYYFGKKSE